MNSWWFKTGPCFQKKCHQWQITNVVISYWNLGIWLAPSILVTDFCHLALKNKVCETGASLCEWYSPGGILELVELRWSNICSWGTCSDIPYPQRYRVKVGVVIGLMILEFGLAIELVPGLKLNHWAIVVGPYKYVVQTELQVEIPRS